MKKAIKKAAPVKRVKDEDVKPTKKRAQPVEVDEEQESVTTEAPQLTVKEGKLAIKTAVSAFNKIPKATRKGVKAAITYIKP